MDIKTKKALIKSIEKWEGVLKGEVEGGTADCELCKLHNHSNTYPKGCDSACPVKAKSNCDFCYGTPYIAWSEHKLACSLQDASECPDCKRLAKNELEFLQSLLPKEDI